MLVFDQKYRTLVSCNMVYNIKVFSSLSGITLVFYHHEIKMQIN